MSGHRFEQALRRDGIQIIAEIKVASPSVGTILESVDPGAIAREYAAGGAAAVSVVTEPTRFKGSTDFIRPAATAGLPVLMKDFITDEHHLRRGLEAGADAILLMARLLDRQTLVRFLSILDANGRDGLVEVHDELELELAMAAGARIIGVNNRDLRTFRVDLNISAQLAPFLPRDVVRVAESGIRTRADVSKMANAGYDACLVGEALLRSADRAGAVRSLQSNQAAGATDDDRVRDDRVRVKFCGITTAEDALVAAKLGADYLGFVFVENSPRHVSPDQARSIVDAVGHERVRFVGVFRDQEPEVIEAVSDRSAIDMVQLHGQESPELVRRISKPVIKAFTNTTATVTYDDARMLLFDSCAPVCFDRPYFVAGGLTPRNVGAAIAQHHPYGVDVARGVEHSPGVKDHDAMRAFLEAVQ